MTPVARAGAVRARLPEGGLFAGHTWRTAPAPFDLGTRIAGELESLGRVFLQFYRAVNLLYRRSIDGREPTWIAGLLDQGKPAALVELQRDARFRNEIPRVIRPDILLCEGGLAVSELDSVPGGIGLTQWLNETYEALRQPGDPGVIGGASGMADGFRSIFGGARRVRVVVSEESAGYRPEMEWLAARFPEMTVADAARAPVEDGEAVYRFFELHDLERVPAAAAIFEAARAGRITVTPPPRPVFEEKLLFALLWNRNLRGFWRQELGEAFFRRMLALTPRSWVLDPSPLPPQAAYPGLELTDWRQLKSLSQRERELILKVSGFSPEAWGARGVYLGSDLNAEDWAAAVDRALESWPASPYLLQRYHAPRIVPTEYVDHESGQVVPMMGRVRLCPYYFVAGEGSAMRANLGGVLATLCPANKKIIHGMSEAILAPCSGAGPGPGAPAS